MILQTVPVKIYNFVEKHETLDTTGARTIDPEISSPIEPNGHPSGAASCKWRDAQCATFSHFKCIAYTL